MPVTRRQGKGSPPAAATPAGDSETAARGGPETCDEALSDLTDFDSDSDEEMADDFSDYDGEESDGSNYSQGEIEEKRTRSKKGSSKAGASKAISTSSTEPERKRRKVTEATKMKATSRKKSLSALPTMPLDILFEIFAHLLPSDLVSLSRTNKAFRGLLMTRKAITIWKAALKHIPHAPECPAYLSEPQWAALLFGVKECQECGAKPVMKITFALRRRVCTNCLKKRLVRSVKFKERFLHYNAEILDLIPYSNVGGWAHGYASATKFYWDEDIEKMHQKLSMYEKAVHMRQPNARKNLANFKAKCVAEAEAIVNDAHTLKDWENTSQMLRGSARAERVKELQARLEGTTEWTPEDIHNALSLFTSDVAKPVTDEYWKRIWPKLKLALDKAKVQRVEAEHREIIFRRQQLIGRVYVRYLKAFKLRETVYFPKPRQLAESGPFQDVIRDNFEVELTENDFDDKLDQLAGWMQNEKAKVLAKLVSLLPENIVPAPSGASGTQVNTPADSPLAVYSCPACNIASYGLRDLLFGYGEAASHRYHWCHYDSAQIVFNRQGSEAVTAILNVLKLNPTQTRLEELDALDSRFVCMRCPVKRCNKMYGREVMTWRHCAAHYISFHGRDGGRPAWQLLSPAEEMEIKKLEPEDPRKSRASWICGHCSGSEPDVEVRAGVPYAIYKHALPSLFVHLRDDHGIDNPQEGPDYFWHPTDQWSYRMNVILPMGNHHTANVPSARSSASSSSHSIAKCVCLRCPQSNRTFVRQGVLAHLKDKHKIVSAVGGQDFVDPDAAPAPAPVTS